MITKKQCEQDCQNAIEFWKILDWSGLGIKNAIKELEMLAVEYDLHDCHADREDGCEVCENWFNR